MKLRIEFLIISVLLISCSSSPEKQLIEGAEAFLKSSLNDPSSYQPISLTIDDTLTTLESEKSDVESDLKMMDMDISMKEMDIESEKITMDTYRAYRVPIPKESPLKIKKYQKELDSLNSVKNKLISKNDSLNKLSIDNSLPKYVYLNASYRAKNQFGATVLNNSHITYDYNTKSFLVYE